jgi:3-carboxy-cis,cis-muconate cycloisomerase
MSPSDGGVPPAPASAPQASAPPVSFPPAPAPLLGPIFARGDAAAETSDAALLKAMLDAEAALARASAARGLIPPAAAEAIAAACQVDRYDIAAIGREGARHAQPVVALVQALRAAVPDAVAPEVHRGATSQDILDTALMVVARRAVAPLSADLLGAADALAALARAHAHTPIIGRTLLQQALPTTFGLKTAGWFSALDGARHSLEQIAAALPLQLGGPVGALHDPELVSAMAAELDLRAPTLPWHGDRRPVAELAAALGVAAGAVAKFARDVTLMAQNEVGELREAGEGGGSSSMDHKRNPVAAVSAAACAQRAPGLAATLLSAMAGEHERAAGAWQAEWQPLLELLSVTGSAAAWAADLAGRLELDVDRMAANLGSATLAPDAREGCAALVAAALEARRR